jgi:methylmalonyl-CoA mutase N-terminal domain/subunit
MGATKSARTASTIGGPSNPGRQALAASARRWEEKTLEPALKKWPERKKTFETLSWIPIDRLYTPLNSSRDFGAIGYPGEYPFTRGVHPTMYSGRTWSMRMFSGFGTPEDTNKRFQYLLKHGESGLSIAFDNPTLYGLDADDPQTRGEIGKCGVNVSSLDDMGRLLHGIPLKKITTSMTINAPASIIWGMYILTAESQGTPECDLGGTIQNDILKEYIAQKEFIVPPRPALRLVTDTIEYATQRLPRWNPVSVSGYHIREAGSTAVQELAFTLADGFTYVEEAMKRGIDVDAFAPRVSFFFNAHNDFFEEIAKYRAARRIWAKRMKHVYGAKKERSMWMRFHTQTAGCSCTSQLPETNVVRITLQALAGVLGGTQSLHTNSYDEALQLPSESAVRIALRTQQIIAEETGVPATIDPLGGSYFVEWLTDRMEEEADHYFDRIEELGGVVSGIEKGFFQREIQNASFRFQSEVEQGERKVIGVNFGEVDEAPKVPELRISEKARDLQARRLKKLRSERDESRWIASIDNLKKVAETESKNTMHPIMECIKAKATLGEIVKALEEVYGKYRESGTY